jgi:hypothetical protein
MPRKGITGQEALATALIALEQLPPQHQPRAHMDDIRKLLGARCEPETVALHLAQAKCGLFPDLDRATFIESTALEETGESKNSLHTPVSLPNRWSAGIPSATRVATAR